MAGIRGSSTLALMVIAGLSSGCDEEPKAEPPAKPSAAPVASPAPAPAPTPVASAEPEEQHDCPENSKGVGSFDKPCDAKGTERLMKVEWTGKMTDTGPSFRVVNDAKLPIVYGKMAAYFYDKAGKQLKVKDGDKEKPMKWCAGKIFQGPMKVKEKAVITFSCVNASHVPEGTESVEAEMQMVGFTDDEGKQTKFYWRNSDLTPDERPKSKKK